MARKEDPQWLELQDKRGAVWGVSADPEGWVGEGELAKRAAKEPIEGKPADRSLQRERNYGEVHRTSCCGSSSKMRETGPFIMLGTRRPLLTSVGTGQVEQMLQLMGEFLGGESGANIFSRSFIVK